MKGIHKFALFLCVIAVACANQANTNPRLLEGLDQVVGVDWYLQEIKKREMQLDIDRSKLEAGDTESWFSLRIDPDKKVSVTAAYSGVMLIV